MSNEILIDPSMLPDTIVEELKNYTADIGSTLDATAEKYAKKTVKELKKRSPKRNGAGGGVYAKSWQRKKLKNGSQLVYNKKGSLTHLLEKSHLTRNGTTRTNPHPHIEPVRNQIASEYTSEVEALLSELR